jgi:ABC-2 type transport system permease protein
VYYQVDVLPAWLQVFSHVSPATYILNGIRGGIIDGKSLADIWRTLLALAIFGAALIPLGIGVFMVAEQWAKKTGKLKRQG